MLYIMRHGRTDWNDRHKLQGRTDIPLNEEGRRMAEAGRTVTAMEFAPVYLRQSQAEQERLAQGLSIEPVYE